MSDKAETGKKDVDDQKKESGKNDNEDSVKKENENPKKEKADGKREQEATNSSNNPEEDKEQELDPKKALTTTKNWKFRDIWALVAFSAQILIILVILINSLLYTVDYSKNSQSSLVSPRFLEFAVLSFFVVFVTNLMFSALYVFCMYRFPDVMVYGTFVLQTGFWGFFSLLFLVKGHELLFVLSLAILLMEMFAIRTWESKVPYTRSLLCSILEVLKKFPSLFYATVSGYLTCMVFVIVWTIAIFSLIHQFEVLENSLENRILRVSGTLFLLFSIFWTVQVFENVVSFVVANVFSIYYHVFGGDIKGEEDGGFALDEKKTSPVLSSIRRSVTYSLGSICLGAIFNTTLGLLNGIVSAVRDETLIATSRLDTVFAYLSFLLSRFNRYAYIDMVVTGRDFRKSSKAMWTKIGEDKRLQKLDRHLLGKMQFMGVVLSIFVSGSIGYLIIRPHDFSWCQMTWIVFIAAVFGYVNMSNVYSLISMGCMSILSNYVISPDVIKKSHQELFSKLEDIGNESDGEAGTKDSVPADKTSKESA